MGEDAKVDYNPIEKYLKTRDLRESGFMNEDIADFMGITKAQVKENLEVLDLIDDYLSTYGYDGIYTMAVRIEVVSEGGTANYEPVSANRNCRIELFMQ